MSSLSRVLLVCVLVVLAAGAIFFAVSDIPPPLAKVEKVIPDDRLPR